MSNYKRLISYIYTYEGGVKGKNIGYAKLEIRGNQCRIQVSVKKIYVGSSEIGVYLLAPRAEILLGRIFIRGGAGEFRIQADTRNVEGSGLDIEEFYGLTIHDVDSAWQCYTTIWEDAVAQTAELQLAEVTAEKVRRKEESAEGALPISKEIEQELEQEEARLEATAPWEETTEEEMKEKAQIEEKEQIEEPVQKQDFAELEETEEEVKKAEQEPEKTERQEAAGEGEKETLKELSLSKPEEEAAKKEEKPLEMSETALAVPAQEPEIFHTENQEPDDCSIQDPAQLEALDRQEMEDAHRNNLWSRLERLYTKVLAFEYENDCQILSIKPQDIGLLPREVWMYGNNSFLLHGYYNYRHLILARLCSAQGRPRYLLGVPGHYFSNEKHMASMFGFPHFVLAKKQPDGDGRFGYWYTDIRL